MEPQSLNKTNKDDSLATITTKDSTRIFEKRLSHGWGNRMVSMAERITPLPLTSSRADQIFPTLTSVQIERVATHGRRRAVRSGEVLVEQGDRAIPFFVVITGELQAVRPTCAIETLRAFSGAILTPLVWCSSSDPLERPREVALICKTSCHSHHGKALSFHQQ